LILILNHFFKFSVQISIVCSLKTKGKQHQKIAIEGTRKSSRLIAKSKVEDLKELVAKGTENPDVPVASQVLCSWCRESGAMAECNQCRVYDSFIHETCFPREIIFNKYGVRHIIKCCYYM
jgi:hypothetical protein